MLKMAQNMMMNNPSMMAKAQRMMKDPNAMANAMAKLNMSGQDPNDMANMMMQKLSAEANGGVVPDASVFKSMVKNGDANNSNATNKTNKNSHYDVNKNKELLDTLSEELDMLELEEYGNRNKTTKDKSYATLGKRITNLMLEFDKVDVSGSEELREERKEYIQRIQKLGDLVEEN